jgi:hypothetical protein
LAEALSAFRRERRLCDEELSGEQALKRTWAGRGVIAVGGPAQNAWAKARWSTLQLTAAWDKNRLLLNPRAGGSAFEGEVGLVTAARNPYDASRPLLSFSASDPALLPALLAEFSGSGDYEVRARGAALKTGSYDKSRLPWRP